MDLSKIPNPLAPENLLKTSGRGIFLMRPRGPPRPGLRKKFEAILFEPRFGTDGCGVVMYMVNKADRSSLSFIH